VLALVFRPRPTVVPPASADTAASAAAPASRETETLPPGISAEDTMPARAARAAQATATRAMSEGRGRDGAGAASRTGPATAVRDSSVARVSAAPAPAAPPVDSSPAAPAPTPRPAAAPTASAAAAPASGASALLGTNAPGAAPRAAAAARKEVEQAIRDYAAAIDNGNAGEAQRLFPGMAPAQRSYLANLFEAGGHMRTRWKVSDIAITGDSATARVRGTTRTLPANGAPSEDRVDSRVVLHRAGGSWQLLSF
jgi:hypothetical protein